MRRATQQALSVPTFRTPADCTPWVLGGLWPAELNRRTPETTTLAEYLKKDLERIATSANEKLRAISESDLGEPTRRAEEARVINVARAFAVLRVESTVRQLRREPLGFQPEYLSLPVGPGGPAHPAPRHAAPPDRREAVNHQSAALRQEPRHVAPPSSEPADQPAEPDEAEIDEIEPDVPDELNVPDELEVDEPEPEVITPDAPRVGTRPEPVLIESVREVVVPPRPRESDEHRLRRLVLYVARQEPGLRWAVGQRGDGTTVLVTDLAHGWIPPGVQLPVGVELPAPQRRTGNAAALLGATELSSTYTPGDPFGDAAQFDATPASNSARRAPEVADLSWKLADATHWRDGLPRLVHTLARAGGAGTGVVEAELDVLRVHLDTARYQLLARYPEAAPAVLLNCLLLAAAERIASGDSAAANYHFAWFQVLSAPSATTWGTQP
jgi:hypothetical protein